MKQSENRILPLQKLAIAPPDYAWDAKAAARRVKDTLGWAGLAAYSLWVDASADSESFEAYPLVIVDISEGEPRIVPAALAWARKSATEMDDEARKIVETRLEALEERLKESTESETEQESTKDEKESGQGAEESEMESKKVGEEEASRIVEKLSARGSLLPAWGREPLVGFIAGLSKEETLSDGFEQFSPADFFKKMMESLPAFIPSSEFASPQAPRDNSLEALGRRIAGSLG